MSLLHSRLLGFSGTVVERVVFNAAQILVSVRLRSRRLRCPCGRTLPASYDRSRLSWRHLDLRPCFIRWLSPQ